jgi:hypothetical protein
VDVLFHPEAEAELAALPEPERAALDHAFEKLEALGIRLPFPHQSDVQGAEGVRELRPRAVAAGGERSTGGAGMRWSSGP